MKERIRLVDVYRMEERANKAYGYRRHDVCSRNGKLAIDILNQQGGCVETYRAGMTKPECYDVLHVIAFTLEAFNHEYNKLISDPGLGQALGCMDCAESFVCVDDLQQHEAQTGHGGTK